MSFFDLYEDGVLDIIMNQCSRNGVLDIYQQVGTIRPIVNALLLDAFFMKVFVLNNMPDEIIADRTIDFRFNTNGAHVDMFVTSLSGDLIPTTGDLLSNPGRSLELPFLHFGLGRTNNYV